MIKVIKVRSWINNPFQQLFVLLNVQSCINNNERLRFSEYKRIRSKGWKSGVQNGWDVEHINPRSNEQDENNMIYKDSIANLILLDSGTNREGAFSSPSTENDITSYAHCKSYSDKRKIIIERLKEPGYYMLPITQMAMLKNYSSKDKDVKIDEWTDLDGEGYFDALWKLMQDFCSCN